MRTSLLVALILLAACSEEPRPDTGDIAAAEQLHGVTMTADERRLMLDDIRAHREAFERLRGHELPNSLPPVLLFDPGFELPRHDDAPRWMGPASPLAANDGAYAWLSVAELGELLRAGEVTSVQLTEYFLERIRAHDDKLNAIITLTEALAIEQARRADDELANGIDRGPLHGIPYGLKDIVATPGYPTSWGAEPYRNQVFDEPATVVERLQAAGAVLIAKTAVGELAWGDVWFGGQTRTPWNTEKGASGSSAGSAAGVAAGFFPIAIGTETWGSIVSPSIRNGVIGLRPTFGRVSRHGVMALSWSMDKVGALCRHAEDCGMVLDAIRGADDKDRTSVDAGFSYPPAKEKLRFGYLVDGEKELRDVMQAMQAAGHALRPVSLPDLPVQSMSFLLAVEAAAAFDELTRSNRDELLVRQERNAWPNVLRAARFVPAVEYIQANRLRHRLVEEMQAMFDSVDVVLAPCFSGDQLLATNLSGHPSIALPMHLDEHGMPTGICLVGAPFREGELIATARSLQSIIAFERNIPPGFD